MSKYRAGCVITVPEKNAKIKVTHRLNGRAGDKMG
jgi:hypothetical protein